MARAISLEEISFLDSWHVDPRPEVAQVEAAINLGVSGRRVLPCLMSYGELVSHAFLSEGVYLFSSCSFFVLFLFFFLVYCLASLAVWWLLWLLAFPASVAFWLRWLRFRSFFVYPSASLKRPGVRLETNWEHTGRARSNLQLEKLVASSSGLTSSRLAALSPQPPPIL